MHGQIDSEILWIYKRSNKNRLETRFDAAARFTLLCVLELKDDQGDSSQPCATHSASTALQNAIISTMSFSAGLSATSACVRKPLMRSRARV